MLGLPRVSGVVSIQRLDLNEQVYDSLKTRLLIRELGPRTKLRLQAIADELDVSRSPVQHALTRLVTEGLVEVDRRGYRVREITPTLMCEAYDVRCALELFAADRSVGRVTAEQLGELRRLAAETAEFVVEMRMTSTQGYMAANKAFHEYIVDLAGNGQLSHTYRSLSLHELMERALAEHTTAAGSSTADHERIVRGFEAGDLTATRAAIEANVDTGKQLALQTLAASGGAL
jgi:DNA-binding GntR family transcriptional regulator